jgi:hypothetical protein
MLCLGACRTLNLDSGTVEIPPGYDVFRLQPKLLVYSFVDTTHGMDLHLKWLPDSAYIGFTCIGLSPRTVPDTTGSFVFSFTGLNIGVLQKVDHGDTNLQAGVFLRGDEGSRGTYAITSTGALNLFWSNGVRSRYFDNAAVIRMTGDTIFSDVVRRSNADSVQDAWHVAWLRGDCS